MQFSYNLLLVLHFIGISGLLGGLLAQIAVKPKQLPKFVLHSAWLAFIAAIVMVGINQMMHSDDANIEVLDHIKVAVKSTILILVIAIGYLNFKKAALSNKAWGLMTLLTISNIVIAVFW
jgi:high-affinity Fe2+/Pb2+ permease